MYQTLAISNYEKILQSERVPTFWNHATSLMYLQWYYSQARLMEYRLKEYPRLME